MPEPTPAEQILSDLPTIQQLAAAPYGKHPLLSVILDLAMANAQVGKWAADCQALLAKQAEAPKADAVPMTGEVIPPAEPTSGG